MLNGLKTQEMFRKWFTNIDDDMQTLTEGITFAVCVHLPRVSQGYVFAYTLYTATGELHILVNHGMEQFHLSSNEIENKKSVVYTDPE